MRYWTATVISVAMATLFVGCTATRVEQPDAATEAASAFLHACGHRDWQKASQYYKDPVPDAVKQSFGGIEVIRVGKSYERPHQYSGRFVPYNMRFPSGTVVKRRLAMKSGAAGKWLVDGGL